VGVSHEFPSSQSRRTRRYSVCSPLGASGTLPAILSIVHIAPKEAEGVPENVEKRAQNCWRIHGEVFNQNLGESNDVAPQSFGVVPAACAFNDIAVAAALGIAKGKHGIDGQPGAIRLKNRQILSQGSDNFLCEFRAHKIRVAVLLALVQLGNTLDHAGPEELGVLRIRSGV
jgi:hypothetical protein